MVKKASTAKKRRPVGRPPKDPDDLRSIRFSFRLHPDLYAEVARFSRIQGEPLSTFVERCLISKVTELEGAAVVDSIGRYLPPPTKLPAIYPSRLPAHQRPRRHKDPG